MAIIKDEDNEKTTLYTKKEIEESPQEVIEFDSQWQQLPSDRQRSPPSPPPNCCQHACQSSSSSVPQGDYQWQHGQKSSQPLLEPQWLYGQRSFELMPNQWYHHYHPVGSSNGSSSYGIAQREHMRFTGLGNMVATPRPNNATTTNMPVNPGPLPSSSTTSDMPSSSRSKRMMREMPAPSPSKSKQRTSEMLGSSNTIPSRSDIPGISLASRRTIKDTAGKEESVDDILARALKPTINVIFLTGPL
ncbi:hypothetical protein SLEP1_g17799 [Rubroshorea leprosula]|uniref:Uncharacterized protein n=1 Tax=Rubroshorea leprosula TaxID=152421 RepID=A0AAV5J4C0_9ROSI|nr:hypothetical protein SLEP1_g17799 [Rubroshorea leprosula]